MYDNGFSETITGRAGVIKFRLQILGEEDF